MTKLATVQVAVPTNVEPVKVTDRPVAGAGNGVYQVTVKIDNRKPGSSVVRTIQHQFAVQSE